MPSSTEHFSALFVARLVEAGHQALISVSILFQIPNSSTLYLLSLARSTSLQFLPTGLLRPLRQLSEYLSRISVSVTLPELSRRTATSTVTTTGVSSSDTSTTPTGVSAASFGADAQAGLLTAVAALTAFIATLF
jgi:hypothetical protein